MQEKNSWTDFSCRGVYYITGVSHQGYRSNARSGVEVEEIMETIQNGRVSKAKTSNDGRKSIKLEGDKCIVTINPDTGMLIQCNPRGDR